MGFLNTFRTHPIETVRGEVVDALRHLFSTKQFYGAWQKGLGLDDYCGTHYSKDVLRSIEEDIILNINTYEKRIELKEVSIFNFKSYADFEVKVQGTIEGEDVLLHVHITRKRETSVTVSFF